MRTAARKTTNGARATREQLVSARLRADTLRTLFPQIARLRIELIFNDPAARLPSPSPQLHTLFAAAPAFFRFACPCADCDGAFDLTEAVTALIASSTGQQRAASFTGHLCCGGVRFRDHAVHQSSCSMQLNYQLLAEPPPAA